MAAFKADGFKPLVRSPSFGDGFYFLSECAFIEALEKAREGHQAELTSLREDNPEDKA